MDDDEGAIWADAEVANVRYDGRRGVGRAGRARGAVEAVGKSVRSAVSELLARGEGNYTLEDLLREAEIVQEVKGQDAKLLAYLSRAEVAEELVGLLTTPAGRGASEEQVFRLPHAACEVVCCEVAVVVDAVLPHCAALLAAASGADGRERAPPFRQSCISRVLAVLHKARPVSFAAAARSLDAEALWSGLSRRMDDGSTADVCQVLVQSLTAGYALSESHVSAIAGCFLRSLQGSARLEPFQDARDFTHPELQRTLASTECARILQVINRASAQLPAASVLALQARGALSDDSPSHSPSVVLPSAGDLGGRLKPDYAAERSYLAAVLAHDVRALPDVFGVSLHDAPLNAVLVAHLLRGPAAGPLAQALRAPSGPDGLYEATANLLQQAWAWSGSGGPARVDAEGRGPWAAVVPVPRLAEEVARREVLGAILEELRAAARRSGAGAQGRAKAGARWPVPSMRGSPLLGTAALGRVRVVCEILRCPWPLPGMDMPWGEVLDTMVEVCESFPWHSQLHMAFANALSDVAWRCGPMVPRSFVDPALVRAIVADAQLPSVLLRWCRSRTGKDAAFGRTALTAPAVTIAVAWVWAAAQLSTPSPWRADDVAASLTALVRHDDWAELIQEHVRPALRRNAASCGGPVPSSASAAPAAAVDEVDSLAKKLAAAKLAAKDGDDDDDDRDDDERRDQLTAAISGRDCGDASSHRDGSSASRGRRIGAAAEHDDDDHASVQSARSQAFSEDADSAFGDDFSSTAPAPPRKSNDDDDDWSNFDSAF